MSAAAPLIGGIAGAIVGSFFGAPGLGFAIGAAALGALFPGSVAGPKLGDVHIQGSGYGASIPTEWGDMRAAGNVVDRPAELTPHENSDGGKGGPEVKTTSYTIDFLSIMLCESSGDHRIGPICWINGQRKNVADLPLVVYDGNRDQLPDPTEEAIRGVGMVPAYRGWLRVVLTAWDLPSNVVPQINFEILSGGERTSGPIAQVATAVKSPAWTAGVRITSWPTHWTTDATMGEPTVSSVESKVEIDYGSSAYYAEPVGRYFIDDNTSVYLWAAVSSEVTASGNSLPALTDNTVAAAGGTVQGPNWSSVWGIPNGLNIRSVVLSQNGKILFVLTHPSSSSHGPIYYYKIVGGVIVAEGDIISSGPMAYPLGLGNSSPLGGSFTVAMAENNGRYLWFYQGNIAILGPGNLALTMWKIADNGDMVWDSVGYVAGDIETPVRPSIYVTEDGYCGTIGGGQTALWKRWVADPVSMLLSQIATDVCARDGLTEINVSDIEIPVRGYMLDRTPITGRAALEAILPLFYVLPVDSDDGVKFVRRGKASVVTIPDADLAARVEDQDLPAKLQVIRGNDDNLPAQVVLNYFNANADYLIGTQQSPRRMYGNRKTIITINAAVVFTDSEAKQRVEVLARIAEDERDDYLWYTSRKYIEYEPTDVMTVQGLDLLVTKKVEGAKGVIEWRGKLSRPSSLVQAGVAGDSEGFSPPDIVDAQETELAIIDGPFPEEGREGVMQIAMQGADRRSWKGAKLFKSIDAGANYTEVMSRTSPSTSGEAVDILPNFGGGNELDALSHARALIHPGGGELVSVTREQAENGANVLMWGAEALAFLDAELVDSDATGNTYALGRFLRGLQGTEPMMNGHAVGDLITLMSTAVQLDALYSEYGRTVLYKAVTFGNTLASATPVSFRSNGISRAPWSPVHLGVGVNGSGDYRMKWMGRMRLHNAWLDLVDVPPDEPVEKYRVQIWQDGSLQTVVNSYIVTQGAAFDSDLLTFVAGDPQFQYTTERQTDDFGSPVSSPPVWSVAKWGVLGWGRDSLGRLPLFVPDDSGGYVPPDPPPGDGILVLVDWTTAARVYSGPFGPNDRLSFKTTTGSLDSVFLVRLECAEFGDPPSPRRWALSTIRGDLVGSFSPTLYPFARGNGTNSIFAGFTVGSGPSFAGYPVVPHNTDLYLNIANEATTQTSLQIFCDLINRPI